jgi:hypothetical protein
MLDRHEVLFAEGVAAESLYLGAEAIKSIPDAGLREVEVLLGASIEQLQTKLYDPARPFAAGKRAKRLIDRHRKNRVPIRADLKGAVCVGQKSLG